MRKITKFRYEVVDGEVVAAVVTPVKIGPRVAAQQNKESLKNIGGINTPRFEFAVDQVPGNSHFLILDFTFAPGDDADAYFKIDLSGSKGGSFKDVKRVKASTANKRPTFRFEVPSA